MTDERRSIELQVVVPGTPEEVWNAIATGPGISSWYVPHQVEEREGGRAEASFGPGPEMQVPGRVAAWDPPNRVVFDGGSADDGMAFEWLVEAQGGGTCVVRLVNSGFGSGDEWDDQYDAMTEGWKVFLLNLRLHLEHFAGRQATALIPFATWSGDAGEAWKRLTSAISAPADAAEGDRVELTAADDLRIAGVVQQVTRNGYALLLDHPADGTGFIQAEQIGDQVSVSVWSYLYGDDRDSIAKRDEPRWAAWLEQLGEGPLGNA